MSAFSLLLKALQPEGGRIDRVLHSLRYELVCASMQAGFLADQLVHFELQLHVLLPFLGPWSGVRVQDNLQGRCPCRLIFLANLSNARGWQGTHASCIPGYHAGALHSGQPSLLLLVLRTLFLVSIVLSTPEGRGRRTKPNAEGVSENRGVNCVQPLILLSYRRAWQTSLLIGASRQGLVLFVDAHITVGLSAPL